MAKEDEQVKFNVEDRVTDLSGDRKSTVTRVAKYGAVQVKWDGSQQQLVEVSELKKEES